MQYVSLHTSDDLKPGHSTICLQRNDNRIDLLAYVGGNSEHYEWLNFNVGTRFLRKGFHLALKVNPDVLSPIYIDKNRKEVFTASVADAKDQIFHNNLSIAGFRCNPMSSEEEKTQAFKDLIKFFVQTSQNADYQSETYLFGVHSNSYGLLYNNGGSPDVKITPEDIAKRLMIEWSPDEIRRSKGFQAEM